VFWNVEVTKLPAGSPNTVLGYERDVPTSGGVVLMADMSPRVMTAAQFNTATKPPTGKK
jgi:hypothetical protein